MEIIPRVTDCSEKVAVVRSPIKAFMGDTTLLTREADIMKNNIDPIGQTNQMVKKEVQSKELTEENRSKRN